MFVLTAKLSKGKIAIAAAIVLGIIIGAIVLLTRPSQPAVTQSIATNDDRVAFLASYGWNVNAEPVQTQQVLIPRREEDEVFARYNQLQISQGYNLTDYAGENAMRYVYEVLNYPEATGPVYATVLVVNSAVIGGDITTASPEGIIHGFAKPS